MLCAHTLAYTRFVNPNDSAPIALSYLARTCSRSHARLPLRHDQLAFDAASYTRSLLVVIGGNGRHQRHGPPLRQRAVALCTLKESLQCYANSITPRMFLPA